MISITENNIARQQTYFHYMKSIELFIKQQSYSKLTDKIVSSHSFKCVTVKPGIDYDRIGELLRNAWFTEQQIKVAHNNECYEYSNHWIPIQMYYSCYLLIRCIEIAKQRSGNGEHSSSLKFIANYIRDTSDMFPEPWNIICKNNGSKFDYINMSNDIIVDPVCTLANPNYTDFYSSYSLFLRTTSKKIIEKKICDWKSKNRVNRIPSVEKLKIMENNGLTSIFNCMYRMRLRSNYEDADAFISTIDMPEMAKGFSESILELTSKSLMLLELIICRHISKSKYRTIIESYSEKIKNSEPMIRFQIIKDKF